MNERLFQYIWQQQSFNRSNLVLASGEKIEIIDPGKINTNQGPDFLNASIRIEETILAGQIELHIKASDWFRHFHNEDALYDNVILHVVWENDQQIFKELPTLVLQDRIPKLLLERYLTLMHNRRFIPCEELLSVTECKLEDSFSHKLLFERLKGKIARIVTTAREENYHWEEMFWWQIARAFGGSVNADAFEEMARSIPITVLSRHREQIHQLEAMFLGQGNLLEENYGDHYLVMLQKEYKFLKKKYGLKSIHQPMKFLRMRPPGFPTIRLAQLAMLMHQHHQLFLWIRDMEILEDCLELFEVIANDFWHYHYILSETAPYQPKKVGKDMSAGVFINGVIPLLFSYADHHQDGGIKNKITRWMQELAPENNSIVRGFEGLGINCHSALDSQALIELKHSYCDLKRCLECAIGNRLLKQQAVQD
jgi:hypothetical protein